jgi:hypothetical protein
MVKKPNVVWIFSIIVAFGILNSIYNAFLVLNDPILQSSSVLFYANIISLLVLIPAIIFIYKFFMLKRNSLTWLYVSFGLNVLLNGIAMDWISAILIAGFGWVVWDYISHKKIKKKPLFK